jgi:hypothetical protein
MDDKRAFDFWYAVNNTEIVLKPKQHLETFGATVLNYHLVSQLMDSVERVRVREGRLQAHQPQIITPQAYSRTFLDGFGEEAGRYVDWLRQHEKDIRILQYGYRLKQEAFSEHVISDDVRNVVDRVKQRVEDSEDALGAVLIGVDSPWDVCLVKLFWEVIQTSARSNIQEMESRHLFDDSNGVPVGVRQEIDAAFLAASRDETRVNELGQKLQQCGLFDEYQDRFFSLIKSHRK